MSRTNEFDQPIGQDMVGWEPPEFPAPAVKRGRSVTLEPLSPGDHLEPLYTTFKSVPDDVWTYMPFGPFRRVENLEATMDEMLARPGWVPFAITIDGTPLGFLTYLRIKPHDGVLEVGGIVFPPILQRTTAATESVYLLLRDAFALGYRRCEWKCDDLNEPSRRAALRLGFRYEGTFSKATHYKGRNRDTAWYAITDDEWFALDVAFQAWLSPRNFDAAGHQVRSLQDFRA